MGIEAVHRFVPGWVLPAAVALYAAVAFLATFALCGLLFLLARRADALRAPWHVRARALYPSRAALVIASIALPATLVVTVPRARGGLLGGDGVVAAAAALASLLAAVFWRRRLARLLVGSAWTFRRALLGMATRVLVMYPHLWLMVVVAFAMPFRFGVDGAALFAVSMPVLVWLARGGGFRMARVPGLAPPAPPEIADELHAAASRAGIPLLGVHIIELPEANAYALPFASRLGFTRSALEKLERKSILAIGGHELTHLGEPAGARRTRLVAMLALSPLLLLKPLVAAGGLAVALLAVVLIVLVGKLATGRLRAFETRADEGAKACEPAPGVYAEALADLYRLNLVPVVFRGATHPHLYDRLVALGAPPPYPRPKPPSRAATLGLFALVILVAVLCGAWGNIASPAFRDRPWAAVALDGGGARTAGDLALAAHAAGRYGEAATLYAAAAALEPGRPDWPAHRSMSLAAAGRVDDALEAFLDATNRAKEWPGACADLLAEAQQAIDRARRR
ncbi:MAG TPA: M48 family metalloprotease [Planctomycetota bacterium]|nr:M48 family metalloprotease [Planctomycetota bacterium]